MKTLLDVKNLKTSFFTKSGEVKAVNDVSFHVDSGEIVAIVGESGCGKSVTQMSIMRLLQSPPGKILGGNVLFEDCDLLKISEKEMQKIRGSKISMVFQEPMTSLNPVLRIGDQVTEVIMTHSGLAKKEAWEIGIKALEEVGIPNASERMKAYPFEMSGGMRQRVLIAIAVACNSKLIIADEPTTALDVTTQAQVMELLLDVVKKHGTSVILITHNLGLVTRYANRIYVMYAGRIVESGTTESLLTNPKHPYTEGLLKSVPKIEAAKSHSLVPIEGNPPNLANLPEYCSFEPRCKYAKEVGCSKKGFPELICLDGKIHYSRCHRCMTKEEK